MARLKHILRQRTAHERVTLRTGALNALGKIKDGDAELSDCVRTFTEATNQKSQTAAIRLAGVLLKKRRDAGEDAAFLSAAANFLLAVAFECPDAPFSVRAAAIRGAVPLVQEGFGLEMCDVVKRDILRFCSADIDLQDYAAIVAAANAICGDEFMRRKVLHTENMTSATILVSLNVLENTLRLKEGKESRLSQFSGPSAEAIQLAALKILQDLAHSQIVCAGGEVTEPWSDKCSHDLARASELAETVLVNNAIPRTCAMAASMACTTCLCLLAGTESRENLQERLQKFCLERGSEAAAFSRLALLRALIEAPSARGAAEPLLFADNGVFDCLCELTNEADPHLCAVAFEAIVTLLKRAQTISHPLVAVREKALSVITKQWHDRHAGEALQVLVSLSEEDTEFWHEVVKRFLALDWRRAGKYALLIPLLPFVGASKVLKLAPDAQLQTVRAVVANQTIAKVGCDFLRALWHQLKREENEDDFYAHTATSVIRALHEGDFSSRERIAEMALPTYIKLGKVAAISRLVQAAERTESMAPIERTSAVMMTLSFGKKVLGSSWATADEHLRVVTDALSCRDILVRIAAFDFVVAGHSCTEPYKQRELIIVKNALPVMMMPEGSPSQRSRIRQLLKELITRLRESINTARGRAGWWDRERKLADKEKRRSEFELLRSKYLCDAQDLLCGISLHLGQNTYPGGAHKRQLAAVLTLSEASCILPSFENDGDISQRELDLGDCIINGILEGWERNRLAAYHALKVVRSSTFFSESSDERIATALRQAASHLRSPRLREADAGALVYRAVFSHMAASRPSFSFPVDKGLVEDSWDERTRPCETSEALLQFLYGMLTAIQARVELARGNLGLACEQGLAHGPALALRYALEDLDYNLLCGHHKDTHELFSRTVEVCSEGIRVAMQGVAFREPNVSAHQIVDEVITSEVVDERQKFVTSCFLTVSELCTCLGVFAFRAPMKEEAGNGGANGMLSLQSVHDIAGIFDHVLRNTRHTGVIDKCAEALKMLSSRLLRSSAPTLRTLPGTWLNSTISSAVKGDLYVLRRSAGLPYYVLAILSSERMKSQRHLLPNTVKTLLDTARGRGLDSLPFDKAQAAMSHCINTLRILFIDGSLADAMVPYVGEAFEVLLPNFSHHSWLVRNSSTMLFGALLRRGVGLGITHPGGRLQGVGVTGREFFSRYPGLYKALLDELQLDVAMLEHVEVDFHKVENESRRSLFPILCLLASLQPTALNEPNDVQPVEEFLPHLKMCWKSRDEGVRRTGAAAAVAVAVADLSHRKDIIARSLQMLPCRNGARETPRESLSYRFVTFSWPNDGNVSSVSVILSLYGAFLKVDSSAPLIASPCDTEFRLSISVPPGDYIYFYLVDGEVKLRDDIPRIPYGAKQVHPLRVRLADGDKWTTNELHGNLMASAKLLEQEVLEACGDEESTTRVIQFIFEECQLLVRLRTLLTGCPLIWSAGLDVLHAGISALENVGSDLESDDKASAAGPSYVQALREACLNLLSDILLEQLRPVELRAPAYANSRTSELAFPDRIVKRKARTVAAAISICRLESAWMNHAIEWLNCGDAELQKFALQCLSRVVNAQSTGEVALLHERQQSASRLCITSALSSKDDDIRTEAWRLLASALTAADRSQAESLLQLVVPSAACAVNVERRSVALLLLGRVMSVLDEASQMRCAEDWLESVRVSSDPSQPTEVRLAAAQSLNASGVLQRQIGGETRELVAGANLAAVTLLQDDDVDVRDEALTALSSCVESLSTLCQTYHKLCVSPTAVFVSQLEEQLDLYRLPCSGEKGEVGLLSSILEDSRQAASWKLAPTPRTIAAALELGNLEDRRIFDEEEDNLHAEKALQCQLALLGVHWLKLARIRGSFLVSGALGDLCDALCDFRDEDAKKEHLLGLGRIPQVFDVIHSLILRSAALLALHERPSPDDLAMAEQVVKVADQCRLHLASKLCLQALSEAIMAEDSGVRGDKLGEICFLVATSVLPVSAGSAVGADAAVS